MTETVRKRWGSYRVLYAAKGIAVKELTIAPGKSMSYQRHFNRAEIWHVQSGQLTMRMESGVATLPPVSKITIERERWHQAINEGTEDVVAIEIWIGESSEDDIERQSDKLQIKDSA